MITAGIILGLTLFVFAVGRSPVFRVDRAGAAIIGATAIIASGILTFDQASAAIDHRTLALLFSMMIVSANLKLGGFFAMTGDFLLRTASGRRQLLLAVVMTSGILSALCINDIVCLLLTPVVLAVCRRSGAPPLPHLLGLAMASNIGSAATLIGNPQNIMIASLSGMHFGAYFLKAAPIAFAGLVLTYGVIAVMFRRDLEGELADAGREKTVFSPYIVVKTLAVLALILAGFLIGLDMAVTAGVGAAFLLLTRRISPNKIYTSVDFNLLVIFMGLFIVVGGVEKAGLMAWLMGRIAFLDFGNMAVFGTITALLSNVVSNVPAVMLLKYFMPQNGDVWWTALAVFSTVAGNLTITGSIANLIVAEIAKREHVRIGFRDYLKAGFPLTVAVSALAVLVLWP
ncbi:MAG: putative transporter [Syntrophus sp. SKADARSKE-3]|nr:putative transporter [Syntrophus sp. SKADARSKE-3]